MSETRKLVAILAADIAGYSRLVGADEDRTLARLRVLRSDLIDPAISVHHGRVVKRTGDGILIEFRSVVDAVRCAIEVQKGIVERNAGLQPERRIEYRVGIHLGDVDEESDGDLMGDGVNIAARLEGIADRGGICISRQVLDQIEGKLDLSYRELGRQNLKNIVKPVEVYTILFDTAVAPGSQFLTTANLKQEIRYCKAPDGVRLAYATVGMGPPILRSAHWLGHLEYDWELPVARGRTHGPRIHHQPEAQHPKSSAIHKLAGRLPHLLLHEPTFCCITISVAPGQSRRFALQKNSEAYRRQGTVKSVTDLPIGREPRSYLDSDQNFLTSRNTVLKL